MAIDSARPDLGLGGGLRPDEREQVLAAATDLFAREGPPRSTLRWVALVSDVPVELVSSEWPTVEAILVDRGDAAERPSCHLVPIDACYELAGRMRLYWRGFDGGAEARQSIAEFLDAVRSRARLLPEER